VIAPNLAKRGIQMKRQVNADTAMVYFNMEDPVVGGYTPDKVALRRAITMANDRRATVRVLANGQAELATQMIPPPVPGHAAALAMKDPYDPAGARALLDRFGYKDRDGDGFRELPDGKPLLLRKGATPVAADRAASELWTRNLAAIGLRTEFLVQKWPELNKMAEAGQLMIWNLAWITNIPDPDAFYSPLYSRNIGTSNDARLKLPEYDQAYERMRALPEGPERQAGHRKMNELVGAYAPWILETYSYQNRLVQPWVRGLKLHPFRQAPWWYYEVAR
jgi:ABC-type transport system substrate-binding protein